MIVIVGGGPGGRLASIRLASSGKEVLLVERHTLGGQCLHNRCMMVCALNDLARFYSSGKCFHQQGIVGSLSVPDFGAVIRGFREVEEKIASVIDRETKDSGVEVVTGIEASVDGKTVTMGDETLEPDHIIISTGSGPRIPDIPGISMDGVHTYKTIHEIEKIPHKITIIGGGVSSLEYSYIFSSMGSDVTLVARSRILKDFPEKIRKTAFQELREVNIHENTEIVSIDGENRVDGVSVSCNGRNDWIRSDSVLLLAGVLPLSSNISGIKKGADGRILVDDHMMTSVRDVYAAGDVIGEPYLTTAAWLEGYVASENILGNPVCVDYTYLPHSVNLGNELAFLDTHRGGLATSIPNPAGQGNFWEVNNGGTGLSEITFENKSGLITAASSASPCAQSAVSYLAMLMNLGVKIENFEEFPAIHPSPDGLHGLAGCLAAMKKSGRL